jgi:hypothetical protein
MLLYTIKVNINLLCNVNSLGQAFFILCATFCYVVFNSHMFNDTEV